MITAASATVLKTGISASLTGGGVLRRKSKKGSSAFEKRTPRV